MFQTKKTVQKILWLIKLFMTSEEAFFTVYIWLNEAKIGKNSVENRLKKNMFKTIKNVLNVFFCFKCNFVFFGCLKRVLNVFKMKNVFFYSNPGTE